jgi:putative FmdB family regulatory protein
MPIYEYRCQDCGETTEALVSVNAKADVACSKCGSRKLEKKLSTFAVRGSSSDKDAGGSCPTGTCSLS